KGASMRSSPATRVAADEGGPPLSVSALDEPGDSGPEPSSTGVPALPAWPCPRSLQSNSCSSKLASSCTAIETSTDFEPLAGSTRCHWKAPVKNPGPKGNPTSVKFEGVG